MGEGQGRAGRAGRGGAGRGGADGWLFEPTFNRALKLRQADPRITSDAGAFLLREGDHRLCLTADLAAQLTDDRDPQRIRYTQVELLRQHLYALALGYAHQDDQDTLAHDVALKLSVWDRPGRRGLQKRLASQPSDWRLIECLSSKCNRRALRAALSEWVARHQRAAGDGRKVTHGTLDIDPFPSEVHGQQPGGAYHGYYRQTMYHPLVASFSAAGDYDAPRLGEGFVHAILRRGNNLTGMLRGELEDASGCGWDLKRVQQTVPKAGARVVEHSRRVLVDVARAAGVLWDRLLDRIQRWWRADAWGRRRPRRRRWVAPPAHANLCLVLRE